MNEQLTEAQRRILATLDDELRFLHSQGVFTRVDVQKMRNQFEISVNALLTAREEPGFSDAAKDKLTAALWQDFEKSIQNTFDSAIGRKGDRALLIYRLHRIDKRIRSRALETGMPQNELHKLLFGMDLLRSYIIRSLPERTGIWGAPKVDVDQITKDYEQTIVERAGVNAERLKLAE